MSYRIEVCPNNRATCSATKCKKEGIKITKGDIRHGVMVPFEEKQSWRYRHWGCVTPTVLHNWKESSEMDMELVDGYDTLPEDAQAKVYRALEQGHVDDEDWNGDVECNRFDPKNKNQGMFLKTPMKKAKASSDDDEQDSPAKKQATKKRGRAKKDADDDEEPEPAPKKAKGRPKKAAKQEDDDADDAPPAKKTTKGTKKAQEVSEDVEPVPAKKGRAKKAKPAPTADSVMDEIAAEDEEPLPAKKTKAKKGKAKDADATADDEPKPKPPPKRKGKKAVAQED